MSPHVSPDWLGRMLGGIYQDLIPSANDDISLNSHGPPFAVYSTSPLRIQLILIFHRRLASLPFLRVPDRPIYNTTLNSWPSPEQHTTGPISVHADVQTTVKCEDEKQEMYKGSKAWFLSSYFLPRRNIPSILLKPKRTPRF